MPLSRIMSAPLPVVFATVLLCSAAVQARDEHSGDEATAEATRVFEKGQKLFDNGEYLAAAEAFKRAYRLRPHPAVLANIGYCYRRAGDIPRAVEVFRKYLRKPHEKTKKRNAEIKKYLNKIKHKIGDLAINCYPTRCEVTVDDVPRGVAPATLVLLAGKHYIDIVGVDEEEVRRYEVVIPGGGKLDMDVDLKYKSPGQSREVYDFGPRKEEDVPSDEERFRLRAPFWIATALTIAGGTTVAVCGVLSNRALDEFERGGSVDDDLQKRGENLTLGVNIAIGFTAASAVAAIVFAIVDVRRTKSKNSEPDKTAKVQRFHLELDAFPAFVGLRGRF